MKALQFDIENVPFMSDRGHLLSSVRSLYKTGGMVTTVKFGLEHMIRNVVATFNIPKDKVLLLRKVINGIQNATNYDKFILNIRTMKKLEWPEEKEIMLYIYILKIHPRHWTTFANRSDIPDSRWKSCYEEQIRLLLVLTNT